MHFRSARVRAILERIMRVMKEPEVRKNEILDAAEELFAAMGFEKATVNDILAKVGIAKGTFYYYFKSKEDALDALIERRIHEGIGRAEEIAAAPLPPAQKLLAILMAQKPKSKIQEGFTSSLNEPENARMHQKALAKTVLRLSPCLARVVEEGSAAGVFSTQFPKESVEIFLAAALVLFDDAYFQWQEREMAAKIPAFLRALECTFGAEPGAFADFAQVFSQPNPPPGHPSK